MSDLISRQAALDAIQKLRDLPTVYDCTLIDKAEVKTEIMMLPSADRPKGEWIDTDADDFINIKHRHCSICGEEPSAWSNHKPFRYCPNCGAAMKAK